MTSFEQKVLTAVRRVPKGRVTTYAAVARAIGRPDSARAVGNALHKNPHPYYGHPLALPAHRSDGGVGGSPSKGHSLTRHQPLATRHLPPLVPCHRVVRSDGSLGGFGGGPRRKFSLLQKEGVRIVEGRVLPDYILTKLSSG